ncbi:hypothetical protein PR048_026053 [Dryococelus australis]|uniref:Uncharacterized protein n=1 Tax=Dryococelus australis TaxID=614101 RepID=A0ABQ9GKA5_9NEOP|nr:hypothetical protein PR048_026053 [Dryococelus australis]
MGIVPDDAAGRRVFSGISHFSLHFGAAPYSSHFSLMGSQDLDFKSRPNLFIHSLQAVLTRTPTKHHVIELHRCKAALVQRLYRKNTDCRTMLLVGGFCRGSPGSPILSFRCSSILTSITLIGSQDLAEGGRGEGHTARKLVLKDSPTCTGTAHTDRLLATLLECGGAPSSVDTCGVSGPTGHPQVAHATVAAGSYSRAWCPAHRC